jgi:hypothetical protein
LTQFSSLARNHELGLQQLVTPDCLGMGHTWAGPDLMRSPQINYPKKKHSIRRTVLASNDFILFLFNRLVHASHYLKSSGLR